MAQVHAHLDGVVRELTSGVDRLLSAAGVQVLPGHARFTRPNRVSVEHGDTVEFLDFPGVIVAPGSRSIELPDLPPDMVCEGYKEACDKAALHPVYVVSPNTGKERLEVIAELSLIHI